MTQQPNSQEEKFPCFALFFWPLVPIAIVAFAYLASLAGYQFDSSVIAIVFFLTIFSTLVAFFLSLFTLLKAISILKSRGVTRTPLNYIATAFAFAFDFAILISVIWETYKFVFTSNLRDELSGQLMFSYIA
jgi:hypothetical protein